METVSLVDKPRPGLSPLNRTIVGWKPTVGWTFIRASVSFKSHHSGMETLAEEAIKLIRVLFKSHHSGMETRPSPAGGCPGPRAFKSHHSGMETMRCGYTVVPCTYFKSHHSGMETWRRRRWGASEATLNRTIVGWKQLAQGEPRGRFATLNRTIVGWKHVWWTQRTPPVAALNRTIVGWKRAFRPP